MHRSSKKPGWLVSVGLQLLALVLMIQLAGCSSNTAGTVSGSLVVTGITPATVPATGGQISFNGSNFTPDDTVTIGGNSATVFYGGPTLLTANAPANTIKRGGRGGEQSLGRQGDAVQCADLPGSDPWTLRLERAELYRRSLHLPGREPAEHAGRRRRGRVVLGLLGGMKVGWLGGSGFVTINDIYAPAKGTYTLNVYGVDGDGIGSSGRNFTVSVNGASTQTINVNGPSWSATSPVSTMQVQLNQGGSNSIQFGNAGNYAPDLDYIVISPNTLVAQPACTSAICTYNADSPINTLVTAVVVNCPNCLTGNKVGGFDTGNGSLTFNNVYAASSGTYNVTIYGVDGDGGRTINVAANGSSSPQQVQISGNDWNADASPVTVQVQLNQGNNNTIEINISLEQLLSAD